MQKTHNPSRPPAALPALIRVLLVSNHQLAVWGLEKLLETTASEIAVVGKAGNATDALRLAQQTRPDVVLLCLDMGSPSLNLIPKLLKQKQLRVVAMTGSSNAQASDRAVLSGAHGLLRREDSVDAIIKSIRKVHDGELWLDRATTGRVFGMLTRSDERSDPDAAKIADLTARERNIIATVAHMASARHRKIADLLKMSEHTLRNHLSKIYAKLELSGHFELYLYAQRHGLDKSASE